MIPGDCESNMKGGGQARMSHKVTDPKRLCLYDMHACAAFQ